MVTDRLARRSGELRERARARERVEEQVGPWPSAGEPQSVCAAAVHDPAGQRDESGADGARDGQVIVGGDITEGGAPADEVAGARRACEPGGVGDELPGRAAFAPGPSF